jgi:hypothetical protein
MASRLELHEELCEVLGSRNVYFQTPESVKMHYDAIRYALGGKDLKRANNKIYNSTNRYDGVVITRDPDTTIPDKILNRFEMCSFGRPYTADNLNHYPFTIYY